MKSIFYNGLRNNLILCIFYEVLGCVIALVAVQRLLQRNDALVGCI